MRGAVLEKPHLPRDWSGGGAAGHVAAADRRPGWGGVGWGEEAAWGWGGSFTKQMGVPLLQI